MHMFGHFQRECMLKRKEQTKQKTTTRKEENNKDEKVLRPTSGGVNEIFGKKLYEFKIIFQFEGYSLNHLHPLLYSCGLLFQQKFDIYTRTCFKAKNKKEHSWQSCM